MALSEVPDFTQLSESEQRAVAERLLRIEESGWKPFWCDRHDCDGMPHAVLDEDGLEVIVSIDTVSGPHGEVVSPIVYELPDGELFLGDENNPVDPTEPPYPVAYGRMLYDPAWAHNHAREDQRLPPWMEAWTLFIMSGRGAGKTRTGVEFVTLCARKGLDGAIVGRRGTELVNTHVAEIMAVAHPEFMPEHFASKDILVWPNGAITYLFSAERPENIRSVNLSYVWFDEAAHMDEIDKAWTNAKFAARVKSKGNPIHILVTSTPTGTPWVMKMEDDPKVEVRRVSTYANKANLDAEFLADLETEYEGTRIGRQELHGEVLRDVEGALWNDDLFKHHRCKDLAEFNEIVDAMDDRVLAVDPSGSKGPKSDAHGIMAGGTQHTDENGNALAASPFFVLADGTLKGSPSEMAERTFAVARLCRVNRIVVEKNFGGEHVRTSLTDWAKLHPEKSRDENGEEYKIELLHAVQNKETRAEPTVGKYEQDRVTHVVSPMKIGKDTVGDLSALEREQVMWVPKSRGGRFPSPNRIDALVWMIRELERKVRFAGQVATSADVMSKLKRSA